MKIVNYEEFVRMPAGTVFAPFKPCVLEDCLAIKVDTGEEGTWSGNYYFNGAMPLEPSLGDDVASVFFYTGDETPAEFETVDMSSTDYAYYDQFVVFDKDDIKRLIAVLEWANRGCKGEIWVLKK